MTMLAKVRLEVGKMPIAGKLEDVFYVAEAWDENGDLLNMHFELEIYGDVVVNIEPTPLGTVKIPDFKDFPAMAGTYQLI